MTARPYELLARFKPDGTVAGCHVRTIETINGKDFESDPVPLANTNDPAFAAFSAAFSASVVAEKEALVTAHKAALDAKQSELDSANATITTKNQEINGLDGEIQALESQIEQLTTSNATKQSQLDSYATIESELNAQVNELQSKVSDLEQYRPFNPSMIDATAFYSRITKDEFAALSVSDDETLRTIAKTILAYKTNDWPVVFESPEFQGMSGYLVGTGFLTAERAAQLTADATRAEAYNAD
jgi:polyhydroxyalkanoate synthesis regulator phasin